MSLSRIQRLNIDSTAFEYNNQNVSIDTALAAPIIKVPEAYNVVLEKAEIPISAIPLGILTTPHYIMIDYPPGLPDHPVLEKKLNVFSISGAYFSISELLGKVNKIINGDLLPAVSCGTFGLNNEDNRIEYKFGSPVERAMLAAGVEVYFDARLMYLLDGIPKLYSPTRDLSLSPVMHKLTWTEFLGVESGVVIGQQSTYLLPRLFAFKSIRISSSLPTRPYITYDQLANKTVPSNMLAEIMMESQNYQQGRTNQLYVPQNLIFNELTGVSELSNFQLWFHIHYKDGTNWGLNVNANEYLSVTLAFYRI
jgi:hypothetical protein